METHVVSETILDGSANSASTVPLVSSCLKAFKLLSGALDDVDIPNQSPLRRAIEECNGRFRVWSGNIGAHQTGKGSLDYRLRDASYIKARVLRLLEDLAELLSDATSIVSGARQPLEDVVSDADSSDTESEPEEDSAQDQRPSEMHQILTEVSEVVNCLYRLSMSVRNPTGTQRYIKSAHIDTSYYERYDLEHVAQKFPAAKEGLVERLGKAISRRRQYLKYREMHAAKLSQHLDDEDTATLRSETTATALIEPSGALEDSRSVASESSYATSAGSVQKARMPSMPKGARAGLPFECPYCRTIEVIKDTQAWIKHVYKDLQPYMCTFENCATPNEMYDGRRQWFNHEMQKHRRSWTCHGHCNQAFISEDAFTKHIRKNLRGQYSDSQIPILIEMWGSQVGPHVGSSCPLCSDHVAGSIQLQRHLGRHLEEIALFALPSDDIESDNEDGSQGSSEIAEEANSPPIHSDTIDIICDICQVGRLSRFYHCSVCDDGNYDICERCFEKGGWCSSQEHSMVEHVADGEPVFNKVHHWKAPPSNPEVLHAMSERMKLMSSIGAIESEAGIAELDRGIRPIFQQPDQSEGLLEGKHQRSSPKPLENVQEEVIATQEAETNVRRPIDSGPPPISGGFQAQDTENIITELTQSTGLVKEWAVPGEADDDIIRPRLSIEQTKALEESYRLNPKPTTSVKKNLAQDIGLTLDKVNNWFQNRRAKTKIDRRNQEGLESLQQLRTRDEILGKEAPRHETALDEMLEELAFRRAELEESARHPGASSPSPSDAIGGENAQLEKGTNDRTGQAARDAVGGLATVGIERDFKANEALAQTVAATSTTVEASEKAAVGSQDFIPLFEHPEIVKRARNTSAARKSRQGKVKEFDELAATVEASPPRPLFSITSTLNQTLSNPVTAEEYEYDGNTLVRLTQDPSRNAGAARTSSNPPPPTLPRYTDEVTIGDHSGAQTDSSVPIAIAGGRPGQVSKHTALVGASAADDAQQQGSLPILGSHRYNPGAERHSVVPIAVESQSERGYEYSDRRSRRSQYEHKEKDYSDHERSRSRSRTRLRSPSPDYESEHAIRVHLQRRGELENVHEKERERLIEQGMSPEDAKKKAREALKEYIAKKGTGQDEEEVAEHRIPTVDKILEDASHRQKQVSKSDSVTSLRPPPLPPIQKPDQVEGKSSGSSLPQGSEMEVQISSRSNVDRMVIYSDSPPADAAGRERILERDRERVRERNLMYPRRDYRKTESDLSRDWGIEYPVEPRRDYRKTESDLSRIWDPRVRNSEPTGFRRREPEHEYQSRDAIRQRDWDVRVSEPAYSKREKSEERLERLEREYLRRKERKLDLTDREPAYSKREKSEERLERLEREYLRRKERELDLTDRELAVPPFRREREIIRRGDREELRQKLYVGLETKINTGGTRPGNSVTGKLQSAESETSENDDNNADKDVLARSNRQERERELESE